MQTVTRENWSSYAIDKRDIKAKFTGDKERHFMINRSIHQEAITIINLHKSSSRISK